MESKTVHFTLGPNAGKLLMEIAQEHLLYNYDPKKAIETITESLSGCPMDIAFKILKGDYIINVVEENNEQFFDVKQRSKEDKDFPSLNINEWYSRKHNEIGENGGAIYHALEHIMRKIHKDSILEISFDYNKIIEFAKGNIDPLILDLQCDENIQEICDIVRVTRNYLDTTYKLWNVMDFLQKIYPEEFDLWSRDSEEYSKVKDNLLDTGKHEVVDLVLIRFNNFLKLNYDEFIKKDEELKNYIDAAIVIDKTLSKVIKPVNILDNYSAGWLAPNGNYYGLNGEYANMLHAQIADALQEAGIIPQIDEVKDVIKNTDSWLSHNGWVKIHKDHIIYDSCLNHKFGEKDMDITPAQIKVIYEYGQLCHGGKLRLGLKMEYVSAAAFQMVAENPQHLYEKYFNF